MYRCSPNVQPCLGVESTLPLLWFCISCQVILKSTTVNLNFRVECKVPILTSAFSKTRLPPELRRVLSCESPAVFLHIPLKEKGNWGPFYQLWRVLAKRKTPTSNVTESTDLLASKRSVTFGIILLTYKRCSLFLIHLLTQQVLMRLRMKQPCYTMKQRLLFLSLWKLFKKKSVAAERGNSLLMTKKF